MNKGDTAGLFSQHKQQLCVSRQSTSGSVCCLTFQQLQGQQPCVQQGCLIPLLACTGLLARRVAAAHLRFLGVKRAPVTTRMHSFMVEFHDVVIL